jgi:creatinine amidohydrolase/Fe(II)-dependent formamide hydrolase-like protein
LCYSFSGGKLPGTTDISPETTTRVVTEIGLSIAEQGVRNIILFPGHCGSEHLYAVKEAGYRIMERAPGTTAAFTPILSLSKTWIDLLAGGGEHAGKGETSLMLYTSPHLVRSRRPYDTAKTRKPKPPEKPKTPAFLVKEFVLKRRPVVKREALYKYGVPNDSGLRATRRFGKVLFDEMVDSLARLVKSMEARARKTNQRNRK